MERTVITLLTLMKSSQMLSQPASALTSLQSVHQATILRLREKTLSISRKTFSRIIAKIPLSSVRQNLKLCQTLASWTHRRRASHPSRPLLMLQLPSRRWLHSSTWLIPTLQFSSHQHISSIKTISRWFLSHSILPSLTLSRQASTLCQSQWPNSNL